MNKILIRSQTVLLSILILSSFSFLQVTDSFATSATHEGISSPDTINFRTITNQGTADDVSDPILYLDKTNYRPGETGTVTVTDANANVTSGVIDFTTAIISASSLTLTETGTDTGIFTGTFTVGNTAPSVDYTPDPKNAIRAQIDIPTGFTGDLTFSDSIVTDGEADATCFYPVTGALKITGTLGVQPNIILSYANANFTGVVAGNTAFDLGMYYKASGQQFERITLPFTGGDNNFINTGDKTIESKNSGDTGSLTGLGILDPGGWVGITDYQGEYVLGVDSGCSGGGGGGLVSPGLVVNALAGLTSGGGGGSPQSSLANLITNPVIDVPEEIQQMVISHDQYTPLLPMNPDSFEEFDLPLVINDQGFVLGGFSNTLQTQTLETDTPVTLKFTVYTDDKVQHFSMYTNLRGIDDSIPESDTQILYNDGKDLQIIDPQGFFSDAKITVTEEEDSVKKFITVELTFAKEMDTSHIITRMWDSHLRSGDTHILDAIKVESAQPEIILVPQDTEEIQVEELTVQTIPKWVKNNAGWWVDEQIDDEAFVAGIQYMINNGIMYVPNTGSVNSSVTEIPDWIKNNAGWWAENQISDDDFVKAMEWLITNGVVYIE
ncbi:hypothetical protein [Candidatus Nitrosopumilus sediminis]|uniref:Peptidase n=1 Tax=Candidatus Nitrosopumilus sediminis TaxID=1229909 RepID=K0BBB7_9ARCH|nr:hypothetical protein [Candidatus Nitrosopumilus sediminis]AFS83503.1 hypothetical protein NSED_08555 [Candidatus Nitrosopumilus sediminis]